MNETLLVDLDFAVDRLHKLARQARWERDDVATEITACANDVARAVRCARRYADTEVPA